MITVKVVRKDRVVDGTLKDLSRRSNFTVVDSYKPTSSEIKNLSDFTDLPESFIKKSVSKKNRPNALDVGNYFELTMRVNNPTKALPNHFSQVVFYTSHKRNNIIILHNDKVPLIETFLKEEDKAFIAHFHNSKTKLLFKFIGDFIHAGGLVLEDIEDQIDLIEKNVLKKSDHKFLSDIFKLKKELMTFHKEYVANREALTNLTSMFNVDKTDLKHLSDLKSDCTQIIETVGIFRELINGSIQLHLSVQSHNMNQIMKRLTGFGAIIMIPTLIASIYGMNFETIPLYYWRWGFISIVGFIGIIALGLYIYFDKKDWL